METISKPSLTKLARQAGVKSLSDDCFETIRHVMNNKIDELIKTILIVNSEHKTKTIIVNDVYESLQILNHNVTESSELNTKS
jgi:histone H3/H4